MDYNSLIEVGSKADVILSFNTETTINGKTYAALEPYILLKDVLVGLEYKEFNKNSSSVSNRISHNLISPHSVTIGNVSLSRKLLSLLINFQNTNLNLPKRVFLTLSAERELGALQGTIYLPKDVYNSDSIYVYNSNFEKLTFTYIAASNSITSTLFLNNIDYYVSFSSEITSTKFNLEQPCNFPYFHMEIQGIGNIDKATKEVIIHLEKVSLNSLINFNFFPTDRINIPLEFIIIDGDNYIMFEE